MPTIESIPTIVQNNNYHSYQKTQSIKESEKLQSKIVGYLLDNPNYRAAVIKPFDQLTNAETRMLDNDIPMIIRNLTVKNVMSGE